MPVKEQIEALVREAELYRSQSLLDQSRDKYLELLRFAENHELLSKDNKLIQSIKTRLQGVENEIREIDDAPDSPELTEEVQNLISNLFSFSKDQATASIEGAVALANFGQYDKAVQEFERLIKDGPLPLQAAMNLLRCHLTLATPDAAIIQFKRWASREELPKGDLRYLRGFLKENLEKMNIKADLPEVDSASSGKKVAEKESEVLLDLFSIGVTLMDGPRKGSLMEFDVSFQSGNTVNIIIPSNDRDLANAFKPGLRLPNIQCCSSLAVFNGKGVVSGMTKISSGPKQGAYSLDITIDGG